MTRKSTPAVMRSGFELILPFLRPIEALILDPDVTEIRVNGAQAVFVERAGQLAPLPDARLDERALRVAVKTMARARSPCGPAAGPPTVTRTFRRRGTTEGATPSRELRCPCR